MFTILFTSAGVELVAPPVVTTVEATAGVVTDDTVCVGAGCVVACDTTTGAVAISGPGNAFAETTWGVPDDPV